MTTPLSDEALAEMERRAVAATPGTRWIAKQHPDGIECFGIIDATTDAERQEFVDCFATVYNQPRETAIFIAHARTDVPALIAELRACREGMTTLILTAKLLYANSLACVEQHHGSHEGTPPWLADCWRSIEAARALLPAERKK